MARLDAPTRLRLRVTLLAAVEYVATCLFLAVYRQLGWVEGRVVAGLLAYSIAANVLILGAIASGWSKRLRDPSMTALQMGVSCVRDLAGCLVAPRLWFVFTFNLFIALPFGSLQFSNRTFAWFWLATCAGLGVAYLALPGPLEFRFETVADKALLWLFVSAGLARLMLFNARISALRRKLRSKVLALDEAARRLSELSEHDELTGIPNRRGFGHRMEPELARAERQRQAFYVALVDVDFFKRVNDEHGHAVGDQVLKRLGGIIQGALRSGDCVGRMGGEEFAVLLRTSHRREVRQTLERLRLAVADGDWSMLAPGLRITLSVGSTRWQTADTPETLLARADHAMYAAKRAGRDRVVFDDEAATRAAARA